MQQPIARRTFLRTTGVTLALPFLESMTRAVAAVARPENPRRFLAVGTPFGFDPAAFVPRTAGSDYVLPPHLEYFRAVRGDMTVITGTSHPNTGAAHQTEAVTLTGAAYPDISHNLRNTISLDQEFARRFHGQTRYDSLVLSTGGHSPVPSIAYTNNGVAIPPVTSPSEIFARLFLGGTPQDTAAELARIDEGRSTLDLIGEQARRLGRRVSHADRSRLDEYFESVRSVERQLQRAREWANRPRPAAPGAPPRDITGPGQQRQKLELMFDMVYLAFITDSTRSISLRTFGDHHALTHHGQEPEKQSACRQVEIDLLQTHAALLERMKAAEEGAGGCLLDRTMVLLTSVMRDGNSHRTYDTPTLLAGGGFRHGRHLAFNRPYLERVAAGDFTTAVVRPAMGVNQAPLCNLFVSLLQRAGVETDRFGSSTGPLGGLEMI